MPISRISVSKLFGYFNHDIELKIKDRITIIHGANGVGKTTILRIIENVFNRRIHAIRKIPFDTITIDFLPKAKLTIKKDIKNKRFPLLHFSYIQGKKSLNYTLGKETEKAFQRRFPLNIIERLIDHLERVERDEWLDIRTGEFLSLEDVIFLYGDILPEEFRQFTSTVSDEIQAILDENKVYLIETQRLFTKNPPKDLSIRSRRNNNQERMTVENFSDDLANNIQDTIGESGTLSASQDRKFSRRLLQTSLPKKATEEKIREMYENQTNYQNRLMQAGMMREEEDVPLRKGELDDMERKVLWIHLNDVQDRLDVFDSLLQKAELFMDIINSRFSYKHLKLDQKLGFVFISNKDGANVPLRSLSSGEQHELVLAYDLLFKTPKQALVLIDEPELSLHVIWQRKFLDDIARIAELADLDFLIATHSPTIIHNRRDLMVGLEEIE